MTRFTAPDLSRLPGLPIGTDTFDALKQARIGELVARLTAYGFSYDVGGLETDPLVIAMAEAGAMRELLTITRRDDAIRAILLATSWGAFLDHLGATQIPPVVRKVLAPADAATGTAALLEGDDDYRLRVQLGPEALSTAGPEGAYLFFALAADGVKTAACYGPQSFDGTRANPFTGLGEVHVPVVAAAGDGSAPAALLDAVQAELRAYDRRPLADFVTVLPAVIVPYAIRAVLRVGSGADSEILRAEADRRLRLQAARQHRPAGQMLLQQIYGAAYVPDAGGVSLVTEVRLLSPAADVNSGDPRVTAYRAPYCTDVAVSIEVVDD